MGKAKRKAAREIRRKKILRGMAEWKKKKMDQHAAGIKSGTDPARWRDPKTGEKAKSILRGSLKVNTSE